MIQLKEESKKESKNSSTPVKKKDKPKQAPKKVKRRYKETVFGIEFELYDERTDKGWLLQYGTLLLLTFFLYQFFIRCCLSDKNDTYYYHHGITDRTETFGSEIKSMDLLNAYIELHKGMPPNSGEDRDFKDLALKITQVQRNTGEDIFALSDLL